MLSFTEENYLKALYQLTLEAGEKKEAGTNELASHLGLRPATVNDMLKKLKEKKLIHYEKYGKIRLSNTGFKHGVNVVRKHRLWETFLCEKLGFHWDEVHDIAEQLEHIQSEKLIAKLDEFLEFPDFDPHGDAIPDAKGKIKVRYKNTLAEIEPGTLCKMVAVKDNSAPFLQYVIEVGLGINNEIKVISRQEYDGMLTIKVNGKQSGVSQKFAENIFVICHDCMKGKSCKLNCT